MPAPPPHKNTSLGGGAHSTDKSATAPEIFVVRHCKAPSPYGFRFLRRIASGVKAHNNIGTVGSGMAVTVSVQLSSVL
ncbi:hypothetical protein GCM10023212_13420 [Luteolibacter yonseiensis]